MLTDMHETTPTKFVQAGNIRFAYRRFGKRGGTALLLLNYFSANMDDWDPMVMNGLAADREVIMYDYPGVGGSTAKRRRPSLLSPGTALNSAARSSSKKSTFSGFRSAA